VAEYGAVSRSDSRQSESRSDRSDDDSEGEGDSRDLGSVLAGGSSSSATSPSLSRYSY
jgi:hypothetical protein